VKPQFEAQPALSSLFDQSQHPPPPTQQAVNNPTAGEDPLACHRGPEHSSCCPTQAEDTLRWSRQLTHRSCMDLAVRFGALALYGYHLSDGFESRIGCNDGVTIEMSLLDDD